MEAEAIDTMFNDLESNDPTKVENAKLEFRSHFKSIKESKLMNGMYDFYVKKRSLNSIRYMEVLANITQPHYSYLFEKLSSSINGNKVDEKVQALNLLGHLIRNEVEWLFKISEHNLLKDLIRLLKLENEILPLLSALLVFVLLLPVIPSHIGKTNLNDVFQIFNRLAAWNCTSSDKLANDQMVHLQIALYLLFQRLYVMFPCNFFAYLRNEYSKAENYNIFTHTIYPMLSTVKMHPALVTTSSKIEETLPERWIKKNPQDVILDCERLTLGIQEHCLHETCMGSSSSSQPFRPRSGTNSSTFESQELYDIRKTPMATLTNNTLSPSMFFTVIKTPKYDPPLKFLTHNQNPKLLNLSAMQLDSQEGTSPPEAAIEATPETTPIKDMRVSSHHYSSQHGSHVPRALTSFQYPDTRPLSSVTTTPAHSQPSSPMRKDLPTINYPTDGSMNAKLKRIALERSQAADENSNVGRAVARTKAVVPTTSSFASASPIMPSCANSNKNHQQQFAMMPSTSLQPSVEQRNESPISQEDQEVVAIVGEQSNSSRLPTLQHCDSVIKDVDTHSSFPEDGSLAAGKRGGGTCDVGGLHMPNMKILHSRIRYHSHCISGIRDSNDNFDSIPKDNELPQSKQVRRANSCPEIEKMPTTGHGNFNSRVAKNSVLAETDEESVLAELRGAVVSNGNAAARAPSCMANSTQTESFGPYSYEQLFLSIFPAAATTAPITTERAPRLGAALSSPGPQTMQSALNTNDVLDKFADLALHMGEPNAEKQIYNQYQLLQQHLTFERYRRESHALRNRRLLTNMRESHISEEQVHALNDQLKLLQSQYNQLHDKFDAIRKKESVTVRDAQSLAQSYKKHYLKAQAEVVEWKDKHDHLQRQLDAERKHSAALATSWKVAEEKLLNSEAEVKISKEQIAVGQKCRTELEHVSRELVMSGELLEKYRSRLAAMQLLPNSDLELNQLTQVYGKDVALLQQQIDTRQSAVDACRQRIGELEKELVQREEATQALKKSLKHVQEESHEKLAAVQSRYSTLLAINRSLEEKLFEQWQQLEAVNKRGGVNSPDTSSCHEVNVTTSADRTSAAAGGLSPHSSPLSASLASSEGSVAFLHPEGREMRNLQVIVDQAEPPAVAAQASTTPDSDLAALDSASALASSSAAAAAAAVSGKLHLHHQQQQHAATTAAPPQQQSSAIIAHLHQQQHFQSATATATYRSAPTTTDAPKKFD